MKKIAFMLVAMLAVACTAQAQGTWKKTVTEADELKDEVASDVFVYNAYGIGQFILWNWDEYQFRLVSDNEQFNIDSGYSSITGGYAGIQILVGIYDDDNNLIEKFKMWLDKESNNRNQVVRTRNAGTMANPVGQKGKVKKIFKALLSGTGYVRIVAERFQTTDFDMKIIPYSKPTEPSEK